MRIRAARDQPPGNARRRRLTYEHANEPIELRELPVEIGVPFGEEVKTRARKRSGAGSRQKALPGSRSTASRPVISPTGRAERQAPPAASARKTTGAAARAIT